MEHDRLVAPLVDAIRMLTREELIDYSGHGSLRRDSASFFINSGASVRSALTAADIVAIDFDGALQEGTERPPLEFPLHAEVYRARPDVQAVLHTHPQWSTLLSMVGVPYRPVFPQGALLGEVPVLDSPLSINTREMGERVAAALGGGRALLLKSHGAVVVGGDMLECFALAMYLEQNASRQYLAMQIGSPYVLSEAEQEACRRRLGTPSLYRKAWDHYLARMTGLPR
ncbi:MAG TPA: class II aldolase/adducin family protein [Vicinamibacterales bacterium]|nr:class II aldolase/adducin family protein [Vicinamibacterales bacterium]